MSEIHFDEQLIVGQLERLSNPLQVAFAAACAERLLPSYIDFSERTGNGDAKEFSSIHERLWEDLEGNAMATSEIEEDIEKCMTLNPALDESKWVEGQDAAEDAAAAQAYALRCRKTGDVHEAAYAARCSYEALDTFVINRENVDTNQPGAEQRTLSHPLIQAELRRQRRDLNDLVNFGGTEISSVVARLRERAKAEAGTFFTLNN